MGAMSYRVIRNDVLRSKAVTMTTIAFVAAAAMLVALAAKLVVHLETVDRHGCVHDDSAHVPCLGAPRRARSTSGSGVGRRPARPLAAFT
jgi:hypothetical protein